MSAIFSAAAATACLGVLLSLAVADPAPEPSRAVPKVYNALITSNQNLEPSKAFPVYQPVIHDTFAYPFPSVYYPGDFPNIYHYPSQRPLGPPSQLPPQLPQQPPSPPQSDTNPEDKPIQPEAQPAEQPDEKSEGSTTSAPPPPPPRTESPIPLNQFGLPPQVLPIGRVGPPYQGFTPLAPFSYSYPGFRFYDPYEPFPGSPYLNLPQLYRPFPNYLGQNSVLTPQETKPDSKSDTNNNPPSPAPNNDGNDDSILNYPSKDPSIPNVPPPPLTEGGSAASDEKSD